MLATITKADGKPGTVPLNVPAPVYRVTQVTPLLLAERATDCFVTHFATCRGLDEKLSGLRKEILAALEAPGTRASILGSLVSEYLEAERRP
jgi:hypothetical protein